MLSDALMCVCLPDGGCAKLELQTQLDAAVSIETWVRPQSIYLDCIKFIL